jgi:hypothetical protein
MNFAQILARLENMNAEIVLMRSTFSFVDELERWTARIEINNAEKEIKLQAKGTGADVEDALRDAWEKVKPIVNSIDFSKGFDIPLLTVDAEAEREVAF